MSTSGSVDSGGYQGRVLRFEWGTNSISAEKNIRNIWYKVTAVGGSSSIYYHHNETVEINGQNVYSGSDSHSVTTGDVLASGNLDINQNDTPSLTVKMHGGIYSRSDNISKEQSWDLDTIPRYITSWDVQLIAELNTVKIVWKTNESCRNIKFGIDESKMNEKNVVSAGGTEVISNLSPNTEYTVYINFERNDSKLYLPKNQTYKIKTKDYAKIINAKNFIHGDGTSIKITNPASLSLNLEMKIDSNSILTKTNVVTGTNSISFSDTELDKIYKLYGNSSTLTVTFIVSGGGYTNSKTCTITLKGNQKTSRNNVNGSWKRAKCWININDVWKRAVTWQNINGTWRRCI